MKVLLTAGAGPGPASVTRALLLRGHTVRLLSPTAARDALGWPHGVEPWPADVTSAADVSGAAEGCDAVVHMVEVVRDDVEGRVLPAVNVAGTRHVLRDAEIAGVRRFVMLSALLADRAESAYQRSKLEAEGLLRASGLAWTVLRTTSVYGPGDPLTSRLLSVARTLPVIPRLAAGSRRLRPLWHGDLAEAVALTLERDDLDGRVLLLAGPDEVTMDRMLSRVAVHAGRNPARLRLPSFLDAIGGEVARLTGLDAALGDVAADEMDEVIPAGRENALETVLGIRPTALETGLARTVRDAPELPPSRGVGTLEHRTYAVHIRHGWRSASQLRDEFRRHLGDLLPGHAPLADQPQTLAQGDTVWASLPARGRVGMRVLDVAAERIIMVTVEGHPLAALLSFGFQAVGDGVQFEIEVHSRSASRMAAVLVETVGGLLQDALWRTVAERMVARSGGRSDHGVKVRSTTLVGDAAQDLDARADALVARAERERRGNLAAPQRPPRRKKDAAPAPAANPRTATADRRYGAKPSPELDTERRRAPHPRPKRPVTSPPPRRARSAKLAARRSVKRT